MSCLVQEHTADQSSCQAEVQNCEPERHWIVKCRLPSWLKGAWPWAHRQHCQALMLAADEQTSM